MNIKIILSLFLLLNLIPSNSSINKIVEEDDSIVMLNNGYASNINSYDNYLEAYFDNSTSNYSVNMNGSCGYVALSLVLTFYDSYMNDNIVPEQYDYASVGTSYDIIQRRDSPGTTRSTFSNSSFTHQQWYDYMASTEDTLLQSKLLMIASDLGYYNSNSNCASSMQCRCAVLSRYLYELPWVDYQLYTKEINSTEEIRQFTIQQIQLGRPVIMGVQNSDKKSNHAVVAYDYDPVTNDIYCHFGHGADRTRIIPESVGYTTFHSAMALEITGPHSHSYNYGVTIGGVTNYYCYDSRDILSIHNHNYSYSNITTTTHKASCSCGINVVENHHWIQTQVIPGLFYIPMYECHYCGYQTRVIPGLM